MSDPRLHILGIRHHGPGSAASVVAALDALDPACVLVEGPPEADGILEFALRDGMRPPVAILIYREDDPARSVFYPLAEFSPEWQAIRWALARGRTVRFIDLPAGHRLADEAEPDDRNDQAELRRDPLTQLAEAAGESDGESWWNNLVEQAASGPGVFAAIAEAMTAVRNADEALHPLSRREAQREAHMRREIVKSLSAMEGPVAVVCGAWHVSALKAKHSASADRDVLKGLSKVKTVATWVPWTDSRLAAASGYGAGVISPGWYRHIWASFQGHGARRRPLDVTASWQSRVAGLLRDEGLPAATASIIEASRLAMSLAAIRGYPLPGLGEMQDASLSVLCHGDALLLRLVQQRLVIGDEIGEIDAGIPQMPLAEDLQRWQKKLRMKPSPVEEEASVDLRTETGLMKSALLHRLLLLGVTWGRLLDAQAGRGTFREVWVLSWQPELSVKLAEALRHGTTIEQAAGNAALELAGRETTPGRVSEIIGTCLNAGLPQVAELLTVRLQELSVGTADVAQLMLACVPLIQTLRYGTARKMPRDALTQLVSGMSAEICAGLVPASIGLDDDAVGIMADAIRKYDSAVPLFDDPYHRQAWLTALAALEQNDSAAAFLRGQALRRLHDAQVYAPERVANRLSRALSPSVAVPEAGRWLEGFLSGAAQVMLHDAELFGLVDGWLQGLPEDAFVELLPVLRRAVSDFDSMERRRILEQVKDRGSLSPAPAGLLADDPRAAEAFVAALPLLKTILGLGDDAEL